LQALFGRNSEAPIPIVAAATPSECFWAAIEAARIAVKYMVPVSLSDGYLANGAEPGASPSFTKSPDIPVKFETNPVDFKPYRRDPQTLSRPGHSARTGLEHRSGASKSRTSPATSTRAAQSRKTWFACAPQRSKPSRRIFRSPSPKAILDGDLLIVAWGSRTAPSPRRQSAAPESCGPASASAISSAPSHPLPSNVGEIPETLQESSRS